MESDTFWIVLKTRALGLLVPFHQAFYPSLPSSSLKPLSALLKRKKIVTPVRFFVVLLKENLNVSIDLLSIPVRGKILKRLGWDHRLQIQNLFMAFKRVPRWE